MKEKGIDDIWAAGNNIKEINLFDFDENNYTCLFKMEFMRLSESKNGQYN